MYITGYIMGIKLNADKNKIKNVQVEILVEKNYLDKNGERPTQTIHVIENVTNTKDSYFINNKKIGQSTAIESKLINKELVVTNIIY